MASDFPGLTPGLDAFPPLKEYFLASQGSDEQRLALFIDFENIAKSDRSHVVL